MRRMAVAVCGLALVVGGLAIVVGSDSIERTVAVDRGELADQSWAEAVWSSLIPNRDSDEEESDRLFELALRRSQRKAPVMVAMGDAGSGLKAFQSGFNKVVDQATVAHEWNMPVDPEDLFETLQKLQQEAADASTRAYLAAVREEPTYLLAWYRLATCEDRDIARRATAELIRLDPHNAIPYFVKAAQDLESGNVDDTIESLRTGNRQSRCAWYLPELPKRFLIRYPDDPSLQDVGVAGVVASPIALEYLAKAESERMSFRDPLRPKWRAIARRFDEDAWQLQSAGEYLAAEKRLTVLRDFGLRLVGEESRDMITVITGYAFAGMALDQLEWVYCEELDDEKLIDTVALKAARKKLAGVFRTAIDRVRPADGEMKSVFLGQIDWYARQKLHVDQAIDESGISQWLVPQE